ncbi:ribosome-associated translation inhibitor RaiA [Bacillus sp. FJAT-42376]|uniref:ribosome hibernation-promoting factor, HPF/YfiA family n=1 Tax=Bacillus sp. FJAT-42376 TaxID=2014076 RepID=UPI000F51575B|nr:ribosome-associated translation inhibitor RaiA [Bacillus sp. FJAT-42376]AZB44505.1 ribosome-associated translation inhibitor RaiA [Bacillus sp. FJAT-42376]
MRYNVRGENIEVTPALRDYVEKKIGKLERYFQESVDADVHVNLSYYSDMESKVEVTIPMTNLVLRGEEHNEDMYAAIDLVTNKLERQIRKHKTKVNRKFREQDSAKLMFANGNPVETPTAVQTQEDEEDSMEVVRTKRFTLKPMDSEEAILQMNMLGHNFFVFTNAESNRTNVVYKRKDGKYGVIEPNE